MKGASTWSTEKKRIDCEPVTYWTLYKRSLPLVPKLGLPSVENLRSCIEPGVSKYVSMLLMANISNVNARMYPDQTTKVVDMKKPCAEHQKDSNRGRSE